MQESLRENTFTGPTSRQSLLPRPQLPGGDLPYPPHLPGGEDNPQIANGSVVRADGSSDIYVIQSGTRRHIPDVQTLYLEGYTNASVQTVSQQRLESVPTGQAVQPFPYAVAKGEYRSSGGGHIASCHASLNLNTGDVTGTVTTTNYVMFTGYHSGTLVIPRNVAGDPVTAALHPQFRFGVGMCGFGDPQTRTDVIGFSIGASLAKEVCSLDVIITESPDDLDEVLAKLGKIGQSVGTWLPLLNDTKDFAAHVAGRGSTTK
ncbi:MAG TPA: hypothetical protein VFL94_08860 [Actinomycetales bacterium]|nr:hypothetical protein [Actinomycetales bacterium]